MARKLGHRLHDVEYWPGHEAAWSYVTWSYAVWGATTERDRQRGGQTCGGCGQANPQSNASAARFCEKPGVSIISGISRTLGLAPQSAPAPAQGSPDVANIRLLSINDIHGQLADSSAEVDNTAIGGAATLSAYVNQARAENPDGTLLLAAGDLIGAAPPESTLLRHHSTIAVLNAMGVDVATLGNHEFDKGYAEAMRIIFGDSALPKAQREQGIPVTKRKRRGASGSVDAKRGAKTVAQSKGKPHWPGSPFPWVSANVVHKKTGKPVLPPYVIKEINGVKVAIVGAMTKELETATPSVGIPNIKATDPVKAINALVPEIQSKGVKTIVVMIHEGGDADKEDPSKLAGPIVDIANGLHPEVDAIISAHSHKEYATVVNGKQVIQAGDYAKAMGIIDLQVDRKTGDVVGGSSQVVRNAEHDIAPDPLVAGLVERFHKAVAPRTEKVLATLTQPITREKSKSGESVLGSLIADAQRAMAKADVAFMNNGGVRQDIDKSGKLTWGEVFSVQPFGNTVEKLTLTGAQILKVLEQQFQGETTRILQVSGLTMHLDTTKPEGQRVVKVVMADGKPLDPKRSYTVAANSFIADGGDGYTEFTKAKKRTTVGVDIDAIANYLQTLKKIPTTFPGRIILDAGTIPEDKH